MNTKSLEEVFDRVLRVEGFKRRKDTWCRLNDDTVILVNLQKSQWGGQYYANLGVYLRDLGKVTSPAEHQCHVRVRLASIAGADAAALEKAMDLEETGISDEQRRQVIERMLTNLALPFLAERSVLPKLSELHAANQLGPVLITKAAREHLEAYSMPG